MAIPYIFEVTNKNDQFLSKLHELDLYKAKNPENILKERTHEKIVYAEYFWADTGVCFKQFCGRIRCGRVRTRFNFFQKKHKN